MVASWLGETNTAQYRLDESIMLLRGTGDHAQGGRTQDGRTQDDRAQMAQALLCRGALAAGAGRIEMAQPDVEEALEIFRKINERFFSAISLLELTVIMLAQRQPDEARRLLAEASAIARGIGDPWLMPAAIYHQGDVARYQGDYYRAGGYYDESGAMLHAINARGDLARVLHGQAYVALRRGDAHLAGSLFRQGLEIYQTLGIRRGTAECLAGLASVNAAQGRLMSAARLFGFAQTLIEQPSLNWHPADQHEIDQDCASLKKILGEELFNIEVSAGRKQKPETVFNAYIIPDPQ
jgi:tetratricopeptide (TPR) repeat protein